MLKEKNNFEIFRDLSLPVEKVIIYMDVLKNFVILKINGDNKIFLKSVKQTYHYKKISLWKVPKYLLIHFKNSMLKWKKLISILNFH